MRAFGLFLVALALVVAARVPAAGQEGAAGKGDGQPVAKVEGIAYHDAKDADPVRHKLDVYAPKDVKGAPVLVFVHGGGWTKGDKEKFAKFGNTFAGSGVVTVVTNYRLSPGVRHPAHAQDVARAVGWAYRNVERYGGQPDKIFLAGHSAGGHLVALLGTDPSYLEAEKVPATAVKGVIPISGVFTIRPGKLKDVFGTDEDGLRNASPLAHVKAKHVPFLILYADKDSPGFDKMADELRAALEKGRSEARVMQVADRTHGSIMTSMAERDDPATQAALAFIARHSGAKLKGTNGK